MGRSPWSSMALCVVGMVVYESAAFEDPCHDHGSHERESVG